METDEEYGLGRVGEDRNMRLRFQLGSANGEVAKFLIGALSPKLIDQRPHGNFQGQYCVRLGKGARWWFPPARPGFSGRITYTGTANAVPRRDDE